MKDLEALFNEIVKDLNMDDRSDPRQLTLWEINRAVSGMNEASTYLGRVMAEVFNENMVAIPAEIKPLLAEIIRITDEMSKVLSVCSCPDCEALEDCPQCVDDPHGICDDCALYFASEAEEEDDE